METKNLLIVYQRLYKQYGPQYWWPAEIPFEVMVGAILTQSAAWQNVAKAIDNLKAAGALAPSALRSLPDAEIARLIHPSGYYNAKAKKLKSLVIWIHDACRDDISRLSDWDTRKLREELLAVHGIGPETADSILLYAVGKSVFVIDAYTRRVFKRFGITPANDRYTDWQRLFMDNLPQDINIFNEYHALLVRHAKENCRVRPVCVKCCLFDICAYRKAN
jgi:endonuclease-3 related protein